MSEMKKPSDYLDRECCPRCGKPEQGGWCHECQPLDRTWLGVLHKGDDAS